MIVALTGELDLGTVPVLHDALAKALPHGTARVVLDLTGLTFCDSTGIGAFVAAHKYLHSSGVHLALANPSELLARQLEVMGIGRLIPIDGADGKPHHPAKPPEATGAV